jgi:Kef-type K+ transport system membrane component KefB
VKIRHFALPNHGNATFDEVSLFGVCNRLMYGEPCLVINCKGNQQFTSRQIHFVIRALVRVARRAIPLLLAGLASCLVPVLTFAADGASHGPSEVIFLCEIIALLVSGRLLGEVMQRIGQPAVMGQLLAGILLGPLGFWAHSGRNFSTPCFRKPPGQQAMIDAVAQLGILLLLLLTGMETDLAVVRNSRRAAFSVSICGIILPFLGGILLGELIPDLMLPDPARRLVTALFLGVALSISSVKIVAMVVRDVGFLRRTIGQVIVAAAIIDDTIGWIIMSVVFGLALHGGIELRSLAQSIFGTLIFLVLSFTLGRRLVFRVIRWANDSFVSEVPVITAILVVTGLMALTTDAIGVHTVLGAFIAGILVGQSPILTRHIDEQLRGLIVALFMPIFFGLAGLTTNLAVFADPKLLGLTIGLIVIASLGKFSGAFLGGRIGGLSWPESMALGCGMNARGSTEIIVATIGALDGRPQSRPLHGHRCHGGRDDDVNAVPAALGAGPAAINPGRSGAVGARGGRGARLRGKD